MSPENDRTAALQKQSDEVFAAFPDFVKSSFDYYTDYEIGGYAKINGALLSISDMSPELAKHVRRLDYGISCFDLQEDILAFSGDNARHYANWRAGDIKALLQYKSTTTTSSNAEWYFNDTRKKGINPIMVEYRIPRGTRGIFIGDNTKHKRPEDEFLLGRDTQVKVLYKSTFRMVLEVVN